MTLGFVEILNLAALRTLLIGIPESAGLLVFGIGLVITAVLIRRLLRSNQEQQSGGKVANEV